MGFDGILPYILLDMKTRTGAAPTISTLFFCGNHADVLQRSVDSPSGCVAVADLHLIIGSLSFLGRLDEAQTLFAGRQREMQEPARCAARFFLGISLCRHSHYKQSLAFLVANLNQSQASKDQLIRFYAYQGLGFYRFFCGRFRRARRSAQMAHHAAFAAHFSWGKMISMDLIGHSCVQVGEVSLGLSHLARAAGFAKTLRARAR